MATVSLDRVVQAYSAIRDARTVHRHAWEKIDTDLEEDQQKLKVIMLQLLAENGASSIKTDHGTAIRREVMKPSAVDWGAIWEWQKENDAADLVERRLKVKFIQDWMDEHEGVPPPGINVHREYEISVRRPNVAPTNTTD